MRPIFINPSTGAEEDFLTQWETGVSFDFLAPNVQSLVMAIDIGEMKRAAVVPCESEDGTVWKCHIPDTVLQHSGTLHLHATDVSNGSRVVDRADVLVRKRVRPYDYVMVDTDDYMSLVAYVTQASALIARLQTVTEDFTTRVERLATWANTQADEVVGDLERTLNDAIAEAQQGAQRIVDYVNVNGIPTADELRALKESFDAGVGVVGRVEGLENSLTNLMLRIGNAESAAGSAASAAAEAKNVSNGLAARIGDVESDTAETKALLSAYMQPKVGALKLRSTLTNYTLFRESVIQVGNIVVVNALIKNDVDGIPAATTTIGDVTGVDLPIGYAHFAVVSQKGTVGRGIAHMSGAIQLTMDSVTKDYVTVSFVYVTSGGAASLMLGVNADDTMEV